MSKKNILWIGPAFDPSFASTQKAVSIAAADWQIKTLSVLSGYFNFYTVSHLPEPYWPKGKLFPKSRMDDLWKGCQRYGLRYFNLPGFREKSIRAGYSNICRYLLNEIVFDGVVSYTSSQSIASIASEFSKDFNCPWISIIPGIVPDLVADGEVALSAFTFKEIKKRRV